MSAAEPSRAQDHRKLLAYALPILLFIALLGLSNALKTSTGLLWRVAPEFWIYPLQTLLCAAVLFYFRSEYDFQALRRPFFTIAIALFVFLLWIAPQQFLHFPARVTGFNPDTFAARPWLYGMTLFLRFLRLVLVVPLLEEIFWRGLLLRLLIEERFEKVPIGTFSWLSFVAVALAFGFSHSSPDRPAAFAAGALYNLVAYRTKSLSSCVLAHGLTNLALGLWIMATKQWGFW